ncbi:Murinoglobulin-2 [Trichinella spiralis]|uniref:Murinoglobulin-2 n=1 Tax=Trichinella spiralis TaxID=6334 RepID=A0ABR3K9X2_TRISP
MLFGRGEQFPVGTADHVLCNSWLTVMLMLNLLMRENFLYAEEKSLTDKFSCLSQIALPKTIAYCCVIGYCKSAIHKSSFESKQYYLITSLRISLNIR